MDLLERGLVIQIQIGVKTSNKKHCNDFRSFDSKRLNVKLSKGQHFLYRSDSGLETFGPIVEACKY